MPCHEKRTKKYLDRKSPPYGANEADCRGTVKRGNDGSYYTSTANIAGVYKWIKNAEAGRAASPGRAGGGAGGGARRQCQGHKKNGSQCSRMVEAGETYCWQHK